MKDLTNSKVYERTFGHSEQLSVINETCFTENFLDKNFCRSLLKAVFDSCTPLNHLLCSKAVVNYSG